MHRTYTRIIQIFFLLIASFIQLIGEVKAESIIISSLEGDLSSQNRIKLSPNTERYFLEERNELQLNVPRLPLDFDYNIVINWDEERFDLTSKDTSFLIQSVKEGKYELSVSFFKKNGERIKIDHRWQNSKIELVKSEPLITNDAIVTGILFIILAFVFYTSSLSSWSKFYKFVPGLLLCYFIPGILNSTGIISGHESNLYFVASRYLLPASLILLCLSIDLKGIAKLGWKALIMFFAGTLGIVLGGPIAILITSMVAPDLVGGAGPDAVWRGLSTIAGSWIGGGANQTAMKEIYGASDQLFSKMVVIDVAVANIWMGVLLFGVGMKDKIDRVFKGDTSKIDELKLKVEGLSKKLTKIPSTTDLMIICAIGLGGTAIAHAGKYFIQPIFGEMKDTLEKLRLTSLASGFFWLIVIATIVGVALSFTKLKKYEGAGASKIGTVFLYVLIATLGMEMNLLEIFKSPGLFVVGILWMLVHVIVLLVVAKIIKAPFFFVAVGSQANVGGAASAPIVASAFSPALAPVGVLLAVLGYAVGTFGAIICTQLMEIVAK